MIEARNLSGGTRAAHVTQVQFKWNNGGVYGIVGGADASVCLALLAGALLPTEGQVRLNGFDLHAERARVQESVGYLPRDYSPDPNLTPTEYLLFVADVKGMEMAQATRRIQGLLEYVGLDEVRNVLIRKLPFAKRRMLAIAQTLLGSPSFILLDSPLEGLSARDAQFVREWIAQIGEKKTVLFTTKSTATARELCRSVLLLRCGAATESDAEEIAPTAEPTEAEEITDPPKPQRKSRWQLLTEGTQEYEEIDETKETRP